MWATAEVGCASGEEDVDVAPIRVRVLGLREDFEHVLQVEGAQHVRLRDVQEVPEVEAIHDFEVAIVVLPPARPRGREDGLSSVGVRVTVEASTGKGALPPALLEVPAGLRTESLLVVRYQLVLLRTHVDPEAARSDEVRRSAALGARPDRLGVKLLGAPPLADAVEAKDVVALLEDAEASLRGGLLVQHYVHADAARLSRAALHRKRQLHILLVLLHALLPVLLPLGFVEGVEAGLLAQVTQLAVQVGAALPQGAPVAGHLVRAQGQGRLLGEVPRGRLLRRPLGPHDRRVRADRFGRPTWLRSMTVGVVARGQRGVPTGRRCRVVLFSPAGAVRRVASVLSLVSAGSRAGRGIVAVGADVVVPTPAAIHALPLEVVPADVIGGARCSVVGEVAALSVSAHPAEKVPA